MSVVKKLVQEEVIVRPKVFTAFFSRHLTNLEFQHLPTEERDEGGDFPSVMSLSSLALSSPIFLSLIWYERPLTGKNQCNERRLLFF